ncbi:WASH complex subunit 1 [Phymastichus coffea]|uniref:WASH complex subunit 1 n=1 Tax=Phymastichus coffea TaxID=108790 RepID=UPI00273BC7E7|nr:WASH complex subunit 1 [Phymastichus coffea]
MPERIEISVIPQDLRQEETIVQIAEALDNLEFAVSHIFDSINKRITENVERISAIRTRAAKLQGKINYLQTNLNLKAVKLYSAAKYPAIHVYKEYELAVQPKLRKKMLPYAIYKSPVPISDKADIPLTSGSKVENGQYASSLNMQEKLQFYYVKSKPNKKAKSLEVDKEWMYQNVSAIGSLLPFSMKDSGNAYNLQSIQNDDKSQIEDAPDSILQPWHSSEIESPSTYLYAPTLGEAPQMNVPLTLPDLPGVVDDERFSLDFNFQNPIAPSSATATPLVRKDPPTVEENVENLQTIEKAPVAPKIIPIPIQSSSSIPAQPKEQIPKETATIVSTTSQSVVPPPPPPPLPPSANPPDEEEKQQTKQPVKKPTSIKPAAGDDRSNLMAAIRDAGGLGKAKLRHAEPIDKKDRWSSASVGGDLMADLHATLSLRRKGIAGASSSGLAMNALQRLSQIIPAPPKPGESSDRNSVTSESQEDDGWED